MRTLRTIKTKTIFSIFLMLASAMLYAEDTEEARSTREGLLFGASIGGGYIYSTVDSNDQQEASPAIGWKVGGMISQNTALMLYFPSTFYTYEGDTESPRDRLRGLEGVIPAVQFWPGENWWVMGGVGLGLDAPVFYDVKEESEGDYYAGVGALAGVGYEFYHRGNFTTDIQGRIHMGTAEVPEGTRKGVAFNILVGFNWY